MRFETKQVSIIPECRVDTGGMEIDNRYIRIVFVLQLEPVSNRSVVVTDVQQTGGLNSCKEDLHITLLLCY